MVWYGHRPLKLCKLVIKLKLCKSVIKWCINLNTIQISDKVINLITIQISDKVINVNTIQISDNVINLKHYTNQWKSVTGSSSLSQRKNNWCDSDMTVARMTLCAVWYVVHAVKVVHDVTYIYIYIYRYIWGCECSLILYIKSKCMCIWTQHALHIQVVE